MNYYFKDGACHETRGEIPEGATPLDRLPLRGEVVDHVTGSITRCEDTTACAGLPRREIEKAQMMLELEASIMLDGMSPQNGYLAEYCGQTGEDLLTAARRINAEAKTKRARVIRALRVTAVAGKPAAE